MNDIDTIRDKDGKLPSYAWPGGYQILYLDRDNETLCPDCANDGDTCSFGGEPMAYFINWEGPSEYCYECNAHFESEYGDPEETE